MRHDRAHASGGRGQLKQLRWRRDVDMFCICGCSVLRSVSYDRIAGTPLRLYLLRQRTASGFPVVEAYCELQMYYPERKLDALQKSFMSARFGQAFRISAFSFTDTFCQNLRQRLNHSFYIQATSFRNEMRRVVVTGLGAVTPLGLGEPVQDAHEGVSGLMAS